MSSSTTTTTTTRNPSFLWQQQPPISFVSVRGGSTTSSSSGIGGGLRFAPSILQPTSKTAPPSTTSTITEVKEQLDVFLTRDSRNTFIGMCVYICIGLYHYVV